MPIRDLKCEKCGHVIEDYMFTRMEGDNFMKYDEKKKTWKKIMVSCPKCNGRKFKKLLPHGGGLRNQVVMF